MEKDGGEVCRLPEKSAGRQKRRRRNIRIGMVALYLFLLAVRLWGMAAEVSMLNSDIGANCEVSGRIIRVHAGSFGYDYHMKAQSIQTQEGIKPIDLKFQFQSREEIQLHSEVRVSGILAGFSAPENPGEWNKRQYYKGKNIYYRLRKAQPEVIREGTPNRMDRLRQWVVTQSARLLPEEENAVFLSLFAGDRSGLDAELKDNFRKVGVSHVLAVSGLHVGLLVWLLSILLKKLPLRYLEQYGILMAVLIFYLVFTGGQASTLRAVMMFGIMESFYFFKKERSPQRAYGITLAILLLMNPFSVYDIGFVLSFASVGSLLWIYPILFARWPRRLQPIGITLTTQIVLLPLYSLYFHKFSLVAIPANLWIVPAVSCFLGMGGLALGVSAISVDLARILAGGGYFMVKSATWLAEVMAGWRWSELPIRAMTIGEILLFYGIIAVFLWTKQKKYLWGLLFSAVIFVSFSWQPQLTMLDVGQAESMVIEYRSHVLVVDTGLESNRSTASYLAYRGKGRIDMVLLSHLDKDHAGGIEALLKEFEVGSIGISANYRNLSKEYAQSWGLEKIWESYQNLLALAGKYNVPVTYRQAGDTIGIGDLRFSFLYPQAEEIPWKANDFSFVAEMEYGQTQVLFTGDIGWEVEKQLLERNLIRDVEVLKVAHHGSKYSSHDAFLQIVKPELAIISCGRYNRYGHPSESLIGKFRSERVLTRVTAWDGAICLELSENGEVRLYE